MYIVATVLGLMKQSFSSGTTTSLCSLAEQLGSILTISTGRKRS